MMRRDGKGAVRGEVLVVVRHGDRKGVRGETVGEASREGRGGAKARIKDRVRGGWVGRNWEGWEGSCGQGGGQ